MNKKCYQNYGPIKARTDCRIIGKGIDHYIININGKPICIPFWAFEYVREERYDNEDELEETEYRL